MFNPSSLPHAPSISDLHRGMRDKLSYDILAYDYAWHSQLRRHHKK